MDKKESIDPMFVQTIEMKLTRIKNNVDHFEYVGDKELPSLINNLQNSGIIQVKDLYGNLIQLGNEAKMKFQK